MSVSSCQTTNSPVLNNPFVSNVDPNVPSQMIWTEELDQKLINYKRQHRLTTEKIAEKIGAPCTAILIKERYKFLASSSNSGSQWSTQEEALLVKLKKQKYSYEEIAQYLAAVNNNNLRRTSLAIRQHYYLIKQKNPNICNDSLPLQIDENTSNCNQIAEKVNVPCKELLVQEPNAFLKAPINMFSKWSPEEDELLVELNQQELSFEEIAKRLATVNSSNLNRTPQAIQKHYYLLKRKNLTICKDSLRLQIDENASNCNQIAKKIDAPYKELLSQKQNKFLKSRRKKYSQWTPQEDELLVELKTQKLSLEEIAKRLAAVNSNNLNRTQQAIQRHYNLIRQKNPNICNDSLRLQMDENTSNCNQIAEKIDAPCKELLAQEPNAFLTTSICMLNKWSSQEDELLVELKQHELSIEEIAERLAAVADKNIKRTARSIQWRYQLLLRQNPAICKHSLSLKPDQNKRASPLKTSQRTIISLQTAQEETVTPQGVIQNSFYWQDFLNPEIL